MRLATQDLHELAGVAISAATDAGRLIGESRPATVTHKTDGTSLASQVVTEIDRRSEGIIIEHLAPTLVRFELGLLTEESTDEGSRLERDYFWCVDPLDGTLPFIEDTPGSAVSIALVASDGTPVIGVMFDLTSSSVWHAVAGGGAYRDGYPWTGSPEPSDVLSVFADRSFATAGYHDAMVEGLQSIANDRGLNAIRLHMGAGAVMNALGVVQAPPACYLKLPSSAGGGSLWDFAATACWFTQAGAVATDIHGAPLDLNRSDSAFMHHRGVLFATDQRLASELRGFCSSLI
ncbi:MAG: inositol monophosphatase family protein [Actinomycetota bacterium]